MFAMFQSRKFSVSTVLEHGISFVFSKSTSPAASFSLWNSFRLSWINKTWNKEQMIRSKAIGDIIHGPMLAHKAEDEGAMVAEPLGLC